MLGFLLVAVVQFYGCPMMPHPFWPSFRVHTTRRIAATELRVLDPFRLSNHSKTSSNTTVASKEYEFVGVTGGRSPEEEHNTVPSSPPPPQVAVNRRISFFGPFHALSACRRHRLYPVYFFHEPCPMPPCIYLLSRLMSLNQRPTATAVHGETKYTTTLDRGHPRAF